VIADEVDLPFFYRPFNAFSLAEEMVALSLLSVFGVSSGEGMYVFTSSE